MNSSLIKKKELIITGASQGIGKAIIESLDPKLWHIALISKNSQRGDQLLSVLKLKGYSCKFFAYDLADLEQLESKVEQILTEFKNIYAVINNAGIGYPVVFEKIDIQKIRLIFNVNLFAPMLIIKKVLPLMRKNKKGRIINISSVAGKQSVPYLTAYSASKAGLISITQGLSRELAETGITINCLCPACVDTKLAQRGRRILADLKGISFKKMYSQMIKQAAIGRPLLAKEVARVVKFLLQDENSFITGQSINVCGAYEVI